MNEQSKTAANDCSLTLWQRLCAWCNSYALMLDYDLNEDMFNNLRSLHQEVEQLKRKVSKLEGQEQSAEILTASLPAAHRVEQ